MIRVACVGAGYFSQFHYDAWARIDDADVVGVCDREESKARAAASGFAGAQIFADAERMLDSVQPDLVDIIAPPPSHAALLDLCIGRRIPAICQKPFCLSLDEAREMAGRADAAGVPVVVHENFRFQPWYREVRRWIDDGRLGTVMQATFRLRPGDGRGPSAYLDRQPYFQTMQRFLVHETAIHFIDTFRFLFGEVASLYADLARLNPAIAGEDAGLIVMHHDGGVRSLFDGNRLADHVAENRRLTMGEMAIEAEHGTLFLDGNAGLHWRAFGTDEIAPVPYEWSRDGFGGDCVRALQAHVVHHLKDGTPLENDARSYLANLVLEEAAYRSSDAGARIAIET